MGSAGSISGTMTLDNARFLSAMQGAQNAMSGSVGFIQRHAAALASLAGVSVSVAGMMHGFKGALDMGGSLSDLSARTGQSVKDLVILRQAFENAGMGADQVGPAINLMQKALAGVSEDGEPTNKIFERLGLNMESLKSASATEAIQAIADKISALPTAAERAEASMKIFGRSGGSMLALLSDKGALGDAATMVGGQAEILARNAAIFDRASDILNSIGVKLQGFFVGLADKITPALMPLLEMFNKMDFSSWGQKIGYAVSVGLAALRAGELMNILGLGFQVAALKAQGPLLTAINVAVAAFAAGLVAAAIQVGKLLNDAMTGVADRQKAQFRANMVDEASKRISANSKDYGARLLQGERLENMVPFTNAFGVKTQERAEVEKSFKAAVATVGTYEEWLAKRQPGARDPNQTNAESYVSNVVGEMQRRADEIGSKGAMDPASVAKAIGASVAEVVKEAAAAARNAKTDEGAGAAAITAAEKALAEAAAKLVPKAPAEKPEEKKPAATPGGGGGATSGNGVPKIEADQLARVGLFIGNTSAPAMDFARRTAVSTDKLVDLSNTQVDLSNMIKDEMRELVQKDWNVNVIHTGLLQ